MPDHPETQQDPQSEQEELDAAMEEATQQGPGEQQPTESDLQQALAEAQQKAEDNWQLYMRAQAEMENTKRRADKNVENAHKFGLEKFGLELLAVKDSLELGLSVEDADAEKLKEGTELTLKILTQALEKFSIMEVNPVGEAFDPNLHQAMSMQESAEHAPNTVIAVMQKGYLLNDRLLRPAMVMVSKAPA
jgi:molecular chaperone GrpE